MDYCTLLDLTTEIGYQLAISGAETFRVEETVIRIFQAYGLSAEVFAIPNCLIVSIETPDNTPLTQMRRIGHHGTDLDSVEKYNSLSRKICSQVPDPSVALGWAQEVKKSKLSFPFWLYILGNAITPIGFSFIFHGALVDALCSSICGLLIGITNWIMSKYKVNMFINTVGASFVGTSLAYWLSILGFTQNIDAVVISCLMILVPGLLFTNALRDIIYGDTNSGINRIVQVLLIAVAIALGAGAAWTLSVDLVGAEIMAIPTQHPLMISAAASILASLGFNVLFNIHGKGALLTALGSGLVWLAYGITLELGGSVILGSFLATMVGALYSEISARIRKCPAIAYLVISIIPLLPGAGVYYTTTSLLTKDMDAFASHGFETLGIAGAMSVAILIISTGARLWSQRQSQKHLTRKISHH